MLVSVSNRVSVRENISSAFAELGRVCTLAENPEGERARLIDEWHQDASPLGAAGNMAFDEIIDLADTKAWPRNYIDRVHVNIPTWDDIKTLGYWPTCL